MESDAMSSGMYSSVQQQQPRMLGLEMSLHHHHIPQPPPQNPHQMPHNNPMVSYSHHHLDQTENYPQQTQQFPKYPFASKSKNQTLTLSDDDEPGLALPENSADDKRKMSPWQRMKWTDNMVRLLIMVVFYIGDEVGPEGNDPVVSNKKKGGGVLQKKGKWKSVSRAMMERGFYVSPQQCEDKFNDLNKRYKRVNDILGKGTSCKVVENQSLLDGMDHLSPKMKEEVKKLLNSKHLFFREMCAYHNSCGSSGGGGASGSGAQAELAPVPAQQKCLHSHSTEISPVMQNLNEGSKSEEDDENSDEDEDHDDDEEDQESDERSSRKRVRTGVELRLVQELDGELTNKSGFEKRQWMKSKMMGLEEERVGIQSRAFELEKQKLKWLKFSTKKEREMERERLKNERLRLENERMVLLIRQRELDLLEHHHQHQHSSNKRGEPSSITR